MGGLKAAIRKTIADSPNPEYILEAIKLSFTAKLLTGKSAAANLDVIMKDPYAFVLKIKEPTKLTKNILDTHLESYKKTGKKFCFFNRHPDRDEVLEQYTTQIQRITSKKSSLTEKDYEDILTSLVLAKKETLISHKKHSLFASLGITSSRFVDALDKCIKDFIANGMVTKETLAFIEREYNPPPEKDAATTPSIK